MKINHKVLRDGSEQMMFGTVIWREKPVRKRAHRTGWKFSKELLRLRDIEKVILSRHGKMIPDPEDTDDRETCLAYVKAAALALSGQDIAGWCAKWAPWASKHEISRFVAMASSRRQMMTADGVAGLLMVTWKERTELHLNTFGASDMSKADRTKLAQERKRERDKNRKADARRLSGMQDRRSYEAQSLSMQKPWEAEGISRRTWERRRVASLSRVEVIGKGDTLASRAEDDVGGSTHPPVPKPIAVGVAGRHRSPETQFLAELQEAAPHGNGDRLSEKAA